MTGNRCVAGVFLNPEPAEKKAGRRVGDEHRTGMVRVALLDPGETAGAPAALIEFFGVAVEAEIIPGRSRGDHDQAQREGEEGLPVRLASRQQQQGLDRQHDQRRRVRPRGRKPRRHPAQPGDALVRAQPPQQAGDVQRHEQPQVHVHLGVARIDEQESRAAGERRDQQRDAAGDHLSRQEIHRGDHERSSQRRNKTQHERRELKLLRDAPVKRVVQRGESVGLQLGEEIDIAAADPAENVRFIPPDRRLIQRREAHHASDRGEDQETDQVKGERAVMDGEGIEIAFRPGGRIGNRCRARVVGWRIQGLNDGLNPSGTSPCPSRKGSREPARR